MKWFRSNIKRVSQLALFALAIQFALSFGHFHGIVAEAASSQVARSLTTPQSLPDQGPAEHPGDICAICAVMAMANTVLFATPPVVVVPQTLEVWSLVTDADFVRIKAAHAAFQPRAPPVS